MGGRKKRRSQDVRRDAYAEERGEGPHIVLADGGRGVEAGGGQGILLHDHVQEGETAAQCTLVQNIK